MDSGLCYNLGACVVKRFNTMRRNTKQFLCEFILPALLMAVGVYIANIDFTVRSPSIVYGPEAYGGVQKMLINSKPVDPTSNVPVTEITK